MSFGRIPSDDDGPDGTGRYGSVEAGDYLYSPATNPDVRGAEAPPRGKTYFADPPNVLTFDRLREANVARLAHFPGHTDDSWSTADWVVAVVGELGELANNLKKIRRGTSYPGMEMPSEEDIAGEIADTFTYLDLLAAKLGIDTGAVIIRKFNQVSERWGLPDRL